MSLRKPPRLQRGDLIGVISPAAAVEAEALRHGCEALERLGFAVRVGPHALDRQRSGLVCFHGPLVADEFANGFSARALTHLLGLLTTGSGEERLAFPTVIHDGVAEGRLLGGCLSLLVTTLGTPFALETPGSILFIEDVGEQPYRIDRM